MITPIEIQSKTFKSGGLGYDKKDVDSFLREVLKSYEIIYRENMELNDKVSVLNEGIQYYKTIEKTLQKALILAEKTAEDTKSAALEKAKGIEQEATVRAQIIVADAKNELEHIHNQTIQLIQQYEKYKVQFKNLAAAQMELIQSEAFDIGLARLDTFVTTEKGLEAELQEKVKAKNQAKSMTKSKDKKEPADEKAYEEVAATKEEQAADELDTLVEKEKSPIEFDASFMDALDQDDLPGKNRAASIQKKKKFDDYLDDEEDPIHEIEHQEEFSFINLVDEED